MLPLVFLRMRQGENLNRRFITFHTKKRPYIILKWAQTLDGFIDIERTADSPIGANWITSNNACRTLVHRWRSEENGILVGNKTVINDNPHLNVRYGMAAIQPEFLIDRTLATPNDRAIFDGTQPTVVFTGKNSGSSTRKEQFQPHSIPRRCFDRLCQGCEVQMLDYLVQKNIQSIIVEGVQKRCKT